MQTLPDLLAPNLRLVFIGTAAGHVSAARGAYYANASNKFWRTLHAVGLTPTQFAPHDFRDLAALGIGLTDVCKTHSGMDHQIPHASFDAPRLQAALIQHAPRAIAFTSKKAASTLAARPTHALTYGRNDALATWPNAPAVFVLPSPSGAGNRYWDEAPWRALAAWFGAQG